MSFAIRRNTASVRSIWKPMYGHSQYQFHQGHIHHGQMELLQRYSTAPVKKSLNSNSLYVISIPITTHKSYIYCNHKVSLLDASQRETVPQIVRAENKVVGLATKAWNKLSASELSINKSVVKLVRKLLNTIPYDESFLRSFPSKKTMIREINQEHYSELPRTILTSEIESGNYSLDQLKPIPVIHPRFQDPQAILDQLHGVRDNLGAFHRKWALLCGIGIPLTLPLALVPVVPNVPCFYLTYRFYCHLKALMGVHNLGYLLESTKDDSSVESTPHLSFKALAELDVPYLEDATFAKVRAQDSDENEHILVTPEIIDRMVETLDLQHLKDDLHKALTQETARLEQGLASDPVE